MNDAERLSHDPTFTLMGSEKIWERGAAPTSRLQSFETELLAEEEHLRRSDGDQSQTDRQGGSDRFAAARRAGHGLDREWVCRQQEQSAYNGHIESACDQPLLLFNREGDCLAVKHARYYWLLLAKMEILG
jgi:hypothetical protein